MARLVTMVLSLIVGKMFNGQPQTPALFRMSLLVLRKLIQLFLISFGSVLIGVISTGHLLREVTLQLQTTNQVAFSGSIGFSLAVALFSFAVCAWTLRKKNWMDPEEVQPQELPPQPPDLVTTLAALVTQFMEEQAMSRQASANPAAAYSPQGPYSDGFAKGPAAPAAEAPRNLVQ